MIVARTRALTSILAAGVLACSGCPPEKPADYYEAPPIPEPPAVDVIAAETPDAGPTQVEPAPVADAPDAATEEDPPGPDTGERGTPTLVVGGGQCDPSDVVPSFASLFERLSPSVVNIYTQEVIRERLIDPWTGRAAPELVGTSLGSGVVIDSDGSVLTNAHVVENAAEIRVRFHDETEMPARLVGIDLVRDLALVKVDGAPPVEPAEPGDSDRLRVGDWVIAIGNPLGLRHTLTKGIVSAKGRAEFLAPGQGYMDLIQTDAAINRGSSGGPLFDLSGHVVGINTVVSAQGQGIAFAIPWNTVADALPRLEQGGRVSRSWLGVFLRAHEGTGGEPDGVLIEGVVDDSPAMRAGLRPGDIVLRLGDRPVRDVPEFRLQVASSVAGAATRILIRRGRELLELVVRLEEARDP